MSYSRVCAVSKIHALEFGSVDGISPVRQTTHDENRPQFVSDHLKNGTAYGIRMA